jgi:chromosome segregation ATPase
VVAPRLALAAAPATPVSLSTAILAAQEKIDKDTGESDEEAREEEIEGHLEALEDRLGSHHIELERLAHEAARGARTEGLSDEEISQLRAEAQRIAAEARPSAAEMAEMKAQLRKAGEEAKRAVAQADLDRAEVEAALETWRADYQVELEKLRAELESLRKKYD